MADQGNPRVMSAAELAAAVLEPNWADLDPASNRLLIVDLADDPLQAEGLTAARRWLTRQPVPVVGFGDPARSRIDGAVDVIAETRAELDQIITGIDKNPNAAAVLVQVLRGVGSLDTAQALALESLGYGTLQGGREFADWLAAHRTANPGRRPKPGADDVVLLRRRGGTLEIVLNSPENRNALSAPMRDALSNAFKLVAMDNSITRVDVSGNGPCFSAGGDLAEFGSGQDLAHNHHIRMLRMPAQYLAPHADRYTFHLHRACIGAGIEMPAFARRLVATADTVFQLPEVNMGLIPGAGGCVSIPRRIGRQRTAYMAIVGEPVPAERALAWGLIDAIVD